MAKNGQNSSKIAIFKCFGLYLQNVAINFHNFWYGNYPCGHLSENHSVYAGKSSEMAKIWPFLAKIDSVLKVFGF